jgi:hypothetical protein
VEQQCHQGNKAMPVGIDQMSFEPFLAKFFPTPEARMMAGIIRQYSSRCESILEFGSRGGVSATLFLSSLLDARPKWRPRFIGVDLVNDDSIKNLRTLAEAHNLSFEFWQGHSKQYPVHETDGFCWDTFHCGGNLFDDLTRLAPHVRKQIFVLGTQTHGEVSEAVRRNLDAAQVARELQISEEGAKMGLKEGLRRFLVTHPEWQNEREIGEITILTRIKPSSTSLFKA